MNAVPGSAGLTHVPHSLSGSHLLGATGSHKGPHAGWHVQAGRRHIAQSDTVLGEQASQGMHCASMLQVAHHCDLGEEPSHQEGPHIEHLLAPISELSASGPGCSMPWNGGTTSKLPPLQTFPCQAATLTVMPLTVPSSSRMVKMSSRAWVGCSPTPSPALITGLRQCLAASCERGNEEGDSCLLCLPASALLFLGPLAHLT